MSLAEIGLHLGDIDLGNLDAADDAKLSEHFVDPPDVGLLFNGYHTVFLGRKGSGKTAIFVQLERILENCGRAGTIAVKITPDEYVWSSLREYSEQGIPANLAHKNAWKFTLAVEIANRIVTSDFKLSGEANESRKTLRKFLESNGGVVVPGQVSFGPSLLNQLSSLNVSAFGFGLGGGRDRPLRLTPPSLIKALFDTIEKIVLHIPVLVAIDHLDESWEGDSKSNSSLIGLLMAAKELNRRPPKESVGPNGMRVITFLRTDIYESLHYDDKDKHRQAERYIVWGNERLNAMIQQRLPSHVAVDELFEPDITFGLKKPFEYLVSRTFQQPRELLQFLQKCIEAAGPSRQFISKEDIEEGELGYSGWKVKDLKQEFSKAVPEIDPLIDAFRRELHQYESLGELDLLLWRKCRELVDRYGERKLQEMLFSTSAIGIRLSSSDRIRYRFEYTDLELMDSDTISLHPALWRGLNIREIANGSDDLIERRARATSLFERMQKRMSSSRSMEDLVILRMNPRPFHVLQNSDFDHCATALSLTIRIVPNIPGIQPPDMLTYGRIQFDRADYIELRNDLMNMLRDFGFGVEEFWREVVSISPQLNSFLKGLDE